MWKRIGNFIEENLSNYLTRDDVAQANDIAVALDVLEERTFRQVKDAIANIDSYEDLKREADRLDSGMLLEILNNLKQK